MAIERSAKTREQNRLSMWIAALVVGALIMVVLVTCAGLYRRLHSNRERIEEYKKYTKSREYIEEVAREKLGLVYEGEVIFKEEGSH